MAILVSRLILYQYNINTIIIGFHVTNLAETWYACKHENHNHSPMGQTLTKYECRNVTVTTRSIFIRY